MFNKQYKIMIIVLGLAFILMSGQALAAGMGRDRGRSMRFGRGPAWNSNNQSQNVPQNNQQQSLAPGLKHGQGRFFGFGPNTGQGFQGGWRHGGQMALPNNGWGFRGGWQRGGQMTAPNSGWGFRGGWQRGGQMAAPNSGWSFRGGWQRGGQMAVQNSGWGFHGGLRGGGQMAAPNTGWGFRG